MQPREYTVCHIGKVNKSHTLLDDNITSIGLGREHGIEDVTTSEER